MTMGSDLAATITAATAPASLLRRSRDGAAVEAPPMGLSLPGVVLGGFECSTQRPVDGRPWVTAVERATAAQPEPQRSRDPRCGRQRSSSRTVRSRAGSSQSDGMGCPACEH